MIGPFSQAYVACKEVYTTYTDGEVLSLVRTGSVRNEIERVTM